MPYERPFEMSDTDYKKYECVICGFIYDEAEGLPDDGIPPGTLGKTFPKIGSARIAVYPKQISICTRSNGSFRAPSAQFLQDTSAVASSSFEQPE